MWNWLDETDVVHLVSQNVCILFHQMNMLSPDFGRTPTNGSVHGWVESGAGPIGGKDEDLKDYSPLIRLRINKPEDQDSDAKNLKKS